MSQARATTSQTVKSVNYLFNVSSCTNASRSYCPIRSFKALPFVKEIRTLSSTATDVFRESKNDNVEKLNGVYGGNSFGLQRNLSGVYGQSYNHNGNDQKMALEDSSNGVYEKGRHVQGSYRMNSGISKEVNGGGKDEYLKSDVRFQENQGSYNMGEDGLHSRKKCNANGSYSENPSSNHHGTSSGSDSGVVSSPVPNYSQPYEKPFEHGTIEAFDATCKDGNLKDILEVLGSLDQNNVSIDMPRYLFLMKLCGENQALKVAKDVHNHLTRSIAHLDVYICNKILEMYSKCGSMEDAYKVFDKMPQRNLTSWDTMITGLAENGHGEDAIEMFTEFKRVGLKPDNQMFFGVFTACSVLGDMREGLMHFESMMKTYNLVPSMDHYASVVDMLGSSGHLNEAFEFIQKMSIEPSVKIWKVMMNQCRIHGDLELEDRCAEIVDLLEPSSKEESIPTKPWDSAEEKETKKISGFNPLPIDIKRNVYQFRAGDTSHPEHEQLYSQLRGLNQSMKEAGYVPQTRFALHDVDQESKEEALLAHSERLALARALLTSPARAPIRIMKNLRVCGDCHEALKIISKLVARTITARDAKRFHQFENGVCSCGDYW